MSERTDVTTLSPDDTFADPAFAAMLDAAFAQAELAMPETAETIEEYVDESDRLYVGREFSSVEEFARWYAVQGLGSMPFNAIGYHHTFRPHAPNWGGLTSLNNVFDWFHNTNGWPLGLGPQLWVYDGTGPYRSGTPHVYVGTHPAHDGIGIENRNRRWLHIEHIHDGEVAPFTPPMQRVSGQLLAILASRHPQADRQIPLRFVRDGGVDDPGQPLGIMYHRDQNPDWTPGAWPKSCPGLAVSHDVLDPDLLAVANAHTPWIWAGAGEDPVAETGTLLAVDGATARRDPSRAGEIVRQLAAGQPVTTSGYTNRGEVVAGSPRWYRLGDDDTWVHSSGGSYTASM